MPMPMPTHHHHLQPRTPQAPVLRGIALSAFTAVFEGFLGSLIYPLLAESSGISQVIGF